MKRFFASFPVI